MCSSAGCTRSGKTEISSTQEYSISLLHNFEYPTRIVILSGGALRSLPTLRHRMANSSPIVASKRADTASEPTPAVPIKPTATMAERTEADRNLGG